MTKPIDTSRSELERNILALRDGRIPNSCGELADLLDAVAAERDAAQAELVRLHERLEDNSCWHSIGDGPLERVSVEPGSIPDGIECRNDTIKLQDEALATLRAELAKLRAEAEWRPIKSAPKDGTIVDYKAAGGTLSNPGGNIGRMSWVVDSEWDFSGFWDIDSDQEAHAIWWAPPRSLPAKGPRP